MKLKHTLLSILISLTGFAQKKNLIDIEVEYVGKQGKNIVKKKPEVTIIQATKPFLWVEGPLWIEEEQMLLFSDIPANKIYKWDAKTEVISTFLEPSGLTTNIEHSGEKGSNGLLYNNEKQLVLCQHGDRRVAFMETSIKNPKPKYHTLADSYKGKRLNSPNDIVQAKDGTYYFSDPDYGLRGSSSVKEMEKNMVYMLTPKGMLTPILGRSHPNGLALSPDEKYLYVTDSGTNKLYRYVLRPNQRPREELLFDFNPYLKKGVGVPDGLKVDNQGNIFVCSVGGVWVFSQEGNLLVKLKIPQKTSNCSLSKDGKTIFVTNSDRILKIKLR